MGKLFGTDGIRGTVNTYPMTVDVVSSIGKAAAMVLTKYWESKPVFLVGKDTRLSGYAFESAITSGLLAGGADVLLTGPLPTPAISYLTVSMRITAGVVISASHNPYTDNGIKFFSSRGYKLPDDMEEELENIVLSEEIRKFSLPPEKMGKVKRILEARGRYIEFLKSSFPKNLSLEGVKIALDCANGATYKIAPAIFEELGAEVKIYSGSPDGKNINAGCGATLPDFISRKTTESGADVGIAFDGDGDRVIFVDENGEIYDGDYIIALSAVLMKKYGLLKNDYVVGTVMSNMALENFLSSHGIKLVRAKVGDRFVVEEMLRTGSNLGGEQSGHIIFHDYTTTGDGILTALQVLSYLVRENIPLSRIKEFYTPYPQLFENLKVDKKIPLESLEGYIKLKSKFEDKLNEKGRLVIRYSGTEPLLRIMVESEKNDLARATLEELKEFFENKLGGKG